MRNNYFQFKQFRIEQDGAAMKVSTEGCLLGAIAVGEQGVSILDIGTGTGLLALMLAQKLTGKVTSIEADQEAAEQAKVNVAASPWSGRVEVVHNTIQSYAANADVLYGLIVSNPPFYTNYLPSDDVRRRLAMHTYTMSMGDLLMAVISLLDTNGKFYVLYPAYEAGVFAQLARQKGLYPDENHIIRNKPGSSIFRMITCYTKQETQTIQRELVIRDHQGNYSEDFERLLRPYYLHL